MVTVKTDELAARSQALRARCRDEAARSRELRRQADAEIERSALLREILSFPGHWSAPDVDLRRVLVGL